MSESILSAPHFHNEEAAYTFVESRLWPHGAVCPHCGVIDGHYQIKGKTTRVGLWKCKDCRKPFTVKIGTIFEKSHIALRLWLQAIFLISSSKKGISSNQLHRTLGITLKSAWFMTHRIREAMKDGGLDTFGSNGGVVEIDETFIGNDFEKKPKSNKYSRGYSHKNKVFSLIDRNTGRARSIVVDNLKLKTLLPIIQANIDRQARVMTDDAKQYQKLGKHFREHGSTIHSLGRYVDRNDNTIHTNTVEGFFSIFKRGMKGVYQHCGHNHLNRYLAEFDYRYSNRVANGINDTDRAEKLLQGVKGKRLTYETTH
jgi:transposase-like protein